MAIGLICATVDLYYFSNLVLGNGNLSVADCKESVNLNISYMSLTEESSEYGPEFELKLPKPVVFSTASWP